MQSSMDFSLCYQEVGVAYEPGQVIIDNCQPIFKTVNIDFHKRCCNNCLKESKRKLASCSACKLVRYCDKNCRNQDWKTCHEIECNSACFRNFCHEPNSNIGRRVFLFRMYATLKQNPELVTKPVKLHDGTTTCFKDLLEDPIYLAKGFFRQEECKTMIEMVNSENPGCELPLDFFQRLLGIQLSNGYAVIDPTKTHWLGFGVYIEPCVFPHSCTPTAVFVNDGLKLQVRAIHFIANGEQPTISLIKTNRAKSERRRLLQRYRWDCHCKKCEFSSDVNVDYDRLNTMMEALSKLEKNPSANCDWSHVFSQHQEIVEVLRQIYHEFDDRITDQFRTTFNIAMNLGKDLRKIPRFIDATLLHLSITYGEGNICYKDFEAKMKNAPTCSSTIRV